MTKESVQGYLKAQQFPKGDLTSKIPMAENLSTSDSGECSSTSSLERGKRHKKIQNDVQHFRTQRTDRQVVGSQSDKGRADPATYLRGGASFVDPSGMK